MSEPEPTLQRLADLEAIRDLARRYAHCVWQRDAAGASALFTEDGEMDTGDRPPIRGRQALRETYAQMLGPARLQPFVHNHVVELAGDTAEGTCYLDLRAVVDGASMIGAGWYRDRYARVDGVWKFRARTLTMAYFVPLAEGWAGT